MLPNVVLITGYRTDGFDTVVMSPSAGKYFGAGFKFIIILSELLWNNFCNPKKRTPEKKKFAEGRRKKCFRTLGGWPMTG